MREAMGKSTHTGLLEIRQKLVHLTLDGSRAKNRMNLSYLVRDGVCVCV